MTRSLGTDPADIRAERRVRAPRRRRGQEEVARRRFRRLREELRLEGQRGNESAAGPEHRVKIVEVPARQGYFHPLTRGEIRRALDFVGPLAVYGLTTIELRPSVGRSDRNLTVARLEVPGRVVLYAQPKPPWRLTTLDKASIDKLRRIGASVEIGPDGTRVDWTEVALKDFVLFEGLMHEIGHHLIQQHTGKRAARVMRTADHEHRAAAFVDACRRAWTIARLPL